MTLPQPVERLWDELERARTELLRETEELSQRQADWKPTERDWSVGEIVDHLTLAEINTGKLTTKLLKELPAGAAAFPTDLAEFAPVPSGAAGPAEAPPVVAELPHAAPGVAIASSTSSARPQAVKSWRH